MRDIFLAGCAPSAKPAAGLNAAVDFYNQRFSIGLTAQEEADLVAFLRTL